MFVKKTLRAIVIVFSCITMTLVLAACGTSATTDKESTGASSSVEEAVSASSSDATPPSAEAVSSSGADVGSTDGKMVYFAAPLFNQGEKDFNLELTKVLEDHGYQVFLPQRDGYLAAELEGKTEEEMTEMIFAKDCDEVLKADILFINLDGRAPDEGACVELGIAYANGKRCYAVKTDARSMEYGMDINPMITGCCTKVFKNLDGDKLIEELDQYLSENEL